MAFPKTKDIEIPILQELVAIGGNDNVRFLYERLSGYFPQLSLEEIRMTNVGSNKIWRKSVQKAGKSLDDQNLITRDKGIWTITLKGIEVVENETSGFTLTKLEVIENTHKDVQQMLIVIGKTLGFYAEMEVEFYDVIWKENIKTQRYSHLFEVQSKGNIDSAFAKLKRAYELQRTKPFLIVSSERDLNRAVKSLEREFFSIAPVVTILTFSQIVEVHKNLNSISEIISKFLDL